MRSMQSIATAVTTLAIGTVCLAATPWNLEAQTATGSGSQWQRSISVGLPAIEGQTSLTSTIVGVQFTQIRPSRVGLDFSVGTMPYSLSVGTLSVGVRGGLALPLQLSESVMVVPSAGLSFIGGAAIPESKVTTEGGRGYNVGASLIAANKDGSGIRLSATRHQLQRTNIPICLAELGVLLPQKR